MLPNNSNVILTARQAADMYKDTDIRVIESRTVGEGYAAISMFDDSIKDAGEIEEALNDAVKGVETCEVSQCIKD